MRVNFPALRTLCCTLALPLLLTGCFTTGDRESRGVKLSEAMDSAAKGDSRDLGGSSPDDDSSDDHGGGGSVTGMGGWVGATYDDRDFGWQMPFDVTYSIPFSSDFRSMTHYRLTPIAFEDEYNFFGLYIGGGTVELAPNSLPELGTKDQWLLEAGLTYRRYLNSPRQGVSPYFAANLGFQCLGWEYRNPIVAGNDTITRDYLGGMNGSAGFGISTMRDRPLSFFAEVDVGGGGFDSTTGEGFSNDVFDAYGFFSFKVGLTLKF